jgi:hypothetical protein
VVEADLAFQGVDLRDLYRRGSGMTPRSLLVRIRALPRATAFRQGALIWAVLEAEQEAALTSVERLRARTAHYALKGGSGD